VALIADDMGLGKMHCALATQLYLKHIVDETAAGRPLACLGGKSVEELEEVLRIFDDRIEVYIPPSIIIVPANLVPACGRVIQSLIPQTVLNLINLFSRHRLTHNDLHYSSDNPQRGKVIHLISYRAYRTRYNNSDRLDCCNCVRVSRYGPIMPSSALCSNDSINGESCLGRLLLKCN